MQQQMTNALPNFKIYYKATIIKTVCCWHKDRYLWNRIESGNRPIYKWLIHFQHKCQGTLMGGIFSMTGQTCAKKKKKEFDFYLSPHIKSSSGWMLELNIKTKAIKLLEENMEESLSDLEFVNIFETQKSTTKQKYQ